MSSQRDGSPNSHPFQFRLQTLMMLVLGFCGLLGLLRLLGPDARLVLSLMAAALFGAVIGYGFRRHVRGAIVGATFLVLYGLSIRVLEHVGHCAGWPGGTQRYWERYSVLWWRLCDSPHASRAYFLWEYWYEDMQRLYGCEAPLTAYSLVVWLLTACSIFWFGQRLHAALLFPFAVIVSALTGLASRDIDAVFLGLGCGVLLAIPVAGAKRNGKLLSRGQASAHVT